MRTLPLVVAGMILSCIGCTRNSSPSTAPESKPSSAQAEATPSPKPTPTSSWSIQDAETNPIDKSKTQFLSLGSLEGRSESHYISGLGDVPIRKSTAQIVLCFHNGKLCSTPSIGARVDVDGFVTTDGSPVRLKFDDDQPLRQQWAGSDGHKSLFPYGREKQFLGGLLKHKKLYFEFAKYEEAPQVVTFDIGGLTEAMGQAGVKP
jgi:hypothetical protein